MTITPTLITPPSAPTFSAWRVDFDHLGDAMTAMIAAAQLGYQAGASCFPGDPTAPIWQFEFSQPGRIIGDAMGDSSVTFSESTTDSASTGTLALPLLPLA